MQKKLLKRATYLVLPLLFLGLTACSALDRKVVIFPIEKIDIIAIKEGAVLKAPKDGYYISEFYMLEVMQARVDAKN